ncbi:MAG: hypothetical protein KDI09_14625 [Halioglobus sp.]|nr:hypothetical protein [Halioglobus sp.]
MSRILIAALFCLLLAACGGAEAPATVQGSSAAVAGTDDTSSKSQATAREAAGNTKPGLAGRQREIVNPDDATMVFLYFDIAGISPPLASWMEQDRRLQNAAGAEKASLRSVIQQELEAGAASVHDIGLIRLSLNSAKLSAYDPTYGEFTVGALSPSSVVRFSAFRQDVELRFGNGRSAQTWKVPEAEAQAITDRVRNFGGVQLEALLRITGVQPGMSGGTLTVDILEYELRESRDGATVGRVKVKGD